MATTQRLPLGTQAALISTLAMALVGVGALDFAGCLVQPPADSARLLASSAALPSAAPRAPSARAAELSQPSDRATVRATGTLEKSYTGQDKPTIVVHNGYPKSQQVLIDWIPAGTLDPGATRSFELSSGVHTVTSSDGTDPNDNPASITETFEGKYSYRYEILAK